MQLSILLNQPQFNRILLANHTANLDVNVITIGMMEAPDIAEYVVPGQILVTTGFHFQNNIPALIALIEVMSKHRAAAIGIKQHRYFDKIPDVVLQKANDLKFAILLLPADVGLSVIVRDLLHVVLEQQTDQLTNIMQQTLLLSQFILKGRSDQEILTQIASLLGHNVFLINSYGQLISKNNNAIINQEDLEENTRKLDLLSINNQQLLYLKDTAVLLFPLKSDNNLNRRFLILQQKSIEYSEQRLLIENIVNLLSLENMKVQMNISTSRIRQNELFVTLLNQSLSKNIISSNLKLNGFSVDDYYQAFAIEDMNFIKAPNHNSIMHRVSSLIHWFFEKKDITPITIYWNFQLFVLLPYSTNILAELKLLQNFLQQTLVNSKIHIGYTPYEQTLLDIKKLVNEATEALTLSIHSNKAKLTKFRPKQVSDLLQLLPEKETTTFIDNILKPILDIKNKDEREQLLQTIAYYFTENRSILSVSKILFVHRNTTMYRLKKIEKLLGFQLDDFNESEQLQLAIRLYMLNKPKI
ncbi:PucR family transcriptional regulator ligand-binding domain-containing protein [Leuconostoc fallax]|uniref:PucR C-terminal helix-turn-helix domain-containing protein n=1 Tax=Leuconostoc fallax TaxID=1251 RepID=A0A4R5N774_9LACO|nr:PucR family transcriptional regulator [Leuconostoc fallax]MBU7455246.1 PucR family transcriptional regulator ligand-binding domain-containing protein [Leuconostoc fallax]MCO6183500.1 PucR family transcriptional regulator ligand-binding domain-containing protein [Leuconostoc fallax]TDG67647.1 hypothetical protein C5L23_001446 [Leuconostoc fallax]